MRSRVRDQTSSSQSSQSNPAWPGKRSLTQGLVGPIQRQTGPTPKPEPEHPIDSDAVHVDQFAPGTDLSHFDDCGPACVLMALRAMGAAPAFVDKLTRAHEDTSLQHQLDKIRALGQVAPKSIDLVAVRLCLVRTLHWIGVPVPDERKLFPLLSEQINKGSGITGVGNQAKSSQDGKTGPAQDYIRQHCRDGSAVMVLGIAKGGPWGWGGLEDPDRRKAANGAPQDVDDKGGHFVFVWSPDPDADVYIVMDPSWTTPRAPMSITKIMEFIYNRRDANNINVMAVPYATVAPFVPHPPATPPTPPNGALPVATRTKMEAYFSADFSTVRVHEDGAAADAGALAYARGDDLHFAPGQYAPGTPDGDRLIGHELAHVVQQRQGRVAGQGIVDDAALEAEADTHGARAAAATAIPTSRVATTAAPAAAIQRKPADAGPPADPSFAPLRAGLDPLVPADVVARAADHAEPILAYLRDTVERFYATQGNTQSPHHARQRANIETFQAIFDRERAAESEHPAATAAKQWNDRVRGHALDAIVGSYQRIPVTLPGSVVTTFRAPYNINLGAEQDGPGAGKNSPQAIAALAQQQIANGGLVRYLVTKQLIARPDPALLTQLAIEQPTIVQVAIADLCRSKRIGVDCSGFVFHVASQADALLGGTGTPLGPATATGTGAAAMTGKRMSRPVTLAELEPGDTLRFDPAGHHIAIVTRVAREPTAVTLGVAHSNEARFFDPRSGVFRGTVTLPLDADTKHVEQVLRDGVDTLLGADSHFAGFHRFQLDGADRPLGDPAAV